MAPSRYFVFCEYNSHYPHQAIFCPETNDELMEQVENLMRIIPQVAEIEPKVIQSTDSGYKLGEIEIATNATGEPILYFRDLIYTHNLMDEYDYYYSSSDETEDADETTDSILHYYINDENRFLSPNNLYHKLRSMVSYCGVSIEVTGCVILSNVPADYHTPVTLRFFADVSDSNISCDEIKEILQSNEKISQVKVATNNGKIAGYGYVTVTSANYVDDLINHHVEFSGSDKIKFEFDLG